MLHSDKTQLNIDNCNYLYLVVSSVYFVTLAETTEQSQCNVYHQIIWS